MDNCIISKFELGEKEKAIKAKAFIPPSDNKANPLHNQNEYKNPFTSSLHYFDQSVPSSSATQPNLFQQTKTSLHHLSTLAEKPNVDQNQSIQSLLRPLYENISQLHQDILRMNHKAKQQTDLKPKDIHSLNKEMNENKARIQQSLDYVEENDGLFHDEAIVKAIEEIKGQLTEMNKELMGIQDDFEEKFAMIIREQERERIAERLMKGDYGDAPMRDFSSNFEVNISKKYLDNNVNYSDYHSDILDIDYEKMKLYNEYQKKEFNLPKIVRMEEKVFFKPSVDNSSHSKQNKGVLEKNIGNDITMTVKSRGMRMNEQKSQLDTAYTSTNTNKASHNTTALKPSLRKDGSKPMSSSLKDIIIEEENDTNPQQESHMSVADQMDSFQSKMSSLANRIEVHQTNQPQPKKIFVRDKQQIPNEIEPRSSKCKKSYQRLKKPSVPPQYIYQPEDPKQKPRYKHGLYPREPSANSLHYANAPLGKDRSSHSYPYDIPEDKMRDIIQRIIEINIRERRGKKAEPINPSHINIEYQSRSQHPQGGGVDDLMRLLIEKFGDLENALRENRGRSGNDDDFARRITEKIKAEMQINVNIDGHFAGEDNEAYPQPEQEAERDRQWNIGHESFILNKRQSYIFPKEEVGKDQEETVNPFDINRRVDYDELDNMIKMPHQINLGDYEVSSASSVMTDSKHIISKEKQKEEPRLSESNSLSKGQIVTDEEEENASSHFAQGQEKTKSPLDLLLLKNINEALPKRLMTNQLFGLPNQRIDSSSKHSEEDYEEEDSFPSVNLKEIVHIDDNKRLKMLELYNSNEYNQFKQNFPKQAGSATMKVMPNAPIDNSSQLKLRTNTQDDINSIIHKQSLLTEKFKRLAMKSDIISESAEEKESKAYKTDESSELI